MSWWIISQICTRRSDNSAITFKKKNEKVENPQNASSDGDGLELTCVHILVAQCQLSWIQAMTREEVMQTTSEIIYDVSENSHFFAYNNENNLDYYLSLSELSLH